MDGQSWRAPYGKGSFVQLASLCCLKESHQIFTSHFAGAEPRRGNMDRILVPPESTPPSTFHLLSIPSPSRHLSIPPPPCPVPPTVQPIFQLSSVLAGSRLWEQAADTATIYGCGSKMAISSVLRPNLMPIYNSRTVICCCKYLVRVDYTLIN